MMIRLMRSFLSMGQAIVFCGLSTVALLNAGETSPALSRALTIDPAQTKY